MNQLWLKPKVSEKAIALAERGQYVFEVPTSANKTEIERAVKAAFKVEVTSVNLMIAKGEVKLFRRRPGRQPNVKKAVVRLKRGQTIALFEGGK